MNGHDIYHKHIIAQRSNKTSWYEYVLTLSIDQLIEIIKKESNPKWSMAYAELKSRTIDQKYKLIILLELPYFFAVGNNHD